MQKLIFASLLMGGAFLVFNNSLAATATHVVVSQIQTDGIDGVGGTEDDWVELYNPTAAAVDLTGWSIQKTSSTGGSLYRKELTGSMPAHGYFLIVRDHADTTASLKSAANVLAAGSSFSLADNNTVYLVSNNINVDGGTDPDIVDMVGMGTASNFEGAAAPNPADGASIERKLGSGQGNGEDTNNNLADFFAQGIAHPRNSSSPTETPPTPSSPPPPAGGESGGGSGTGFFELEISEIFPNPKGKDAGFEWIEFYNAGVLEVNISGWYLDDEGEEESPSSNAYILPEGARVPGRSYLVVNIPKGKFALNNSGMDAARLFDPSSNLKLRQNYTGPAKEGFAYAKNSANAWEWTENATPGTANNFAILTTYSSSLRISEVLPNPEGDDSEGEFIEIYNSGTDSVDLSDWVVADERKRYVISDEDFADTEIPPNGYFVVYREVSGVSLNNSGEEAVRLINPLGEVVDELKFDAAGKEGESYARELEKFYRWTSFATPGLVNKFVPVQGVDKEIKSKNPRPRASEGAADGGQAKSKFEIPLSEIRSQPLETIITTSGVIVVEPGILGERVAYLGGSGIRIFLPENYDLDLRVGTIVQLEGELATFHNESQLKVNDMGFIKVMGEGEIPYHEILTGEVGEETEGFLVHLAGRVTRNAGDTFYIDDGSGEARILITDSTGIQKPKLKKSDEIEITGIVTQFNDVYRVLPRYQSDLVVASVAGQMSATLPRTGTNFWLMIAFFYLFGIIIKPKIKRKELKNEQNGIS